MSFLRDLIMRILTIHFHCTISTLCTTTNKNSKLDNIFRIISKNDLSTNILLYTNNDVLAQSLSIQIAYATLPSNGNETKFEEILATQFDMNEENPFIAVFDAVDVLFATHIILTIGSVLRKKTSDTSKSRRIPQYFIIWPSGQENNFNGAFDEYWNTQLKASPDFLSPAPMFSLHTQIYIVEFFNQSNYNEFFIYEFYTLPGYNDKAVVICNQLTFENVGIIGVTRNNFHGSVVRASAPEKNLTQGEVTFKEFADGTVDFKDGFGVDIFNALKYALNFNSKVIPSISWATKFPNGSWYGMADDIISGKADISVAKTSILVQRAEDLKYLVPTHGLGVFAFFEQPSANSARNIFFEPFTTWLWLFMMGTYVIIIIISFTSVYIKIKSFSIQSIDDKVLVHDTVIWSIATFCQQGWHITPSSISLRIIFLCGVFLGLILYVAYSATLVSMFSTKVIPIKNLEDLLKSSIKLTVDKNNRGAVLLVNHTHSDKSQHYSRSATTLKEKFGTSTNNLFSIPEGIPLVFQGRTAFLTFKDSFYTTIRNTYNTTDDIFCKKVSSVAVLDTIYKSGIFIAKNSPYREFFNIKLTTMYTSGLMSRYVKGYESLYTPVCDLLGPSDSDFSIEESDVFAAYVLIICGLVGSVTIFIFEYIIFHHRLNDFSSGNDSQFVHVFHMEIKSIKY